MATRDIPAEGATAAVSTAGAVPTLIYIISTPLAFRAGADPVRQA